MEIIAHRGASGLALENTIGSFKKAQELGVKMLEADLRLTKDKKIVVIHDYSLKRTHSINAKIKNLTLNELKLLSGRKDKNQEVPALSELLRTINTPINLDIKVSGMEKSLIRELTNFLPKVLICSWNPLVLKRIRALDKNIQLGLVFAPWLRIVLTPVLKLLTNLSLVFVTVPVSMASQKNIEKFHAQGVKVYVYTVNNLILAKKLKEIGADGIFINNLDLMDI